MKKILRKFSLHTQIIFVNTFILLLALVLYAIYIRIMIDTKFYTNHPTITNMAFWVIITIILMFVGAILTEKLTFPAKEFIGYAKQFENVNFLEISKEMTNSDFIKLANAFNDLQKKLYETVDKIQQKNNEISKLNKDLKNELIYKRDLVTSISHDIKTPLTVISATISAIQDGIFTPEETEEEFKNILLEIEKTTRMLQDTINIYRMDSSISRENTVELNMIEIINSTTKDLDKLFTKYKHTLVLDLKNDIQIKADKDKLVMAIKNLVINAIVHSPENSKIYITLEEKTLEIINTGINIPREDMENIFKPFYRIDKSRTKNDDFGNGLGLYITNEIITKHNFFLGVENVENGVKFYIIFE